MTVDASSKAVAARRISVAVNAEDLGTESGLNAALSQLKWAALADSWTAYNPYMDALVDSITNFGSKGILTTIPDNLAISFFTTLRALNYKDVLNSVPDAGSRLDWEIMIRAYLRWNVENPDVTASIIRSVFDPLLLHAFFMLASSNLQLARVNEHLQEVTALQGLTPATTAISTTNGLDPELDFYVDEYDGHAPYFVARYLDYRTIYNAYIASGIPDAPVDGNDYARLAIQQLDTAMGAIYTFT